LRSGSWRLYYLLTAGGRHRYFTELLPLLHETKHEIMGERDADCYYLVYIGTKPSGQRRGYARKLIQAMATKVITTPTLVSVQAAVPKPLFFTRTDLFTRTSLTNSFRRVCVSF
jgi:GNAT superfamily N-acetyltransferase